MGAQGSHREDIEEICNRLLLKSRSGDFCGFDPFDGLNSAFFKKSSARNIPAARILWLQFHKRSPVNFRQLVGVPKLRNPKGIALFILGLVEKFRYSRSEECVSIAIELADWLLSQCADRHDWTHYAWGYHFDWAARAFYVPRGKPNAITTCYVARALRSLGSLTGNSRFLSAADDAGYFLDSLYTEREGIEYYAYIPGESTFVHNASLWAAAVVYQTAASLHDGSLGARALRVARQSMKFQSPDGSWTYGTRTHHAFIDGFHTGYNLEALSEIRLASNNEEFSNGIERGLRFYKNNFFTDDGVVKYYHNKIWPIDMHSVAQAVLTLLKVGGGADDLRLAGLIVERAIEIMYIHHKDQFVYQRGRCFVNGINYLRWTQAWAFYALSYYICHIDNGGSVK